MEVLITLLGCGSLFYAFCYTINIIGKCYVAHKSKNLSNEKVKALAKMMSKNININLHQ